MTSICVNAKMPDEVDRQVAFLGIIIYIPFTGVDSDICVLVMASNLCTDVYSDICVQVMTISACCDISSICLLAITLTSGY